MLGCWLKLSVAMRVIDSISQMEAENVDVLLWLILINPIPTNGLGVGVCNPRHLTFACSHVRGWNIYARPYKAHCTLIMPLQHLQLNKIYLTFMNPSKRDDL